jgi:DNA-binding IscR family transcriptional regulator
MAIPIEQVQVPDPALQRFIDSTKQALDKITGQQGGGATLRKLPDDATLADVIAVVNQLIDRVS